MEKFKVEMNVTHEDGNILKVEDIYFSGELNCEIIQCNNGRVYCNDEWCEIKPTQHSIK